MIRNSVVRSAGATDSAALWLRDGSGARQRRDPQRDRDGHAPARRTRIHCDLTNGSATIVNSIARGKGYDLDFTSELQRRVLELPARGLDRRHRRHRQPERRARVRRRRLPARRRLADDRRRPARHASRPRSIPTGAPRMLGAAPGHRRLRVRAARPTGDAGTPTPELPDDLKGVPLPKQGRSMVVAAARGTVRVRVPGSHRFTTLEQAGRIPVGSVIDARDGRVRLATAVDRRRAGRPLLGLEVPDPAAPARQGHDDARAARRHASARAPRSRVASRKSKRKRKRGLWARDHGGLYRTRGNDSVATVRGTALADQGPLQRHADAREVAASSPCATCAATRPWSSRPGTPTSHASR